MLNIVLFHPEIAANVGNIMRTSVAISARLHLIGPLPFSLDEHHLKRAGLDYIAKVKLSYYDSYEQFLTANTIDQLFYITRYGKNVYSSANLGEQQQNIFVMFGSESTGIPTKILRTNQANCLRIPMLANVRSLNLSNAVAIVSYEVMRQQGFYELATQETIKGDAFCGQIFQDND